MPVAEQASQQTVSVALSIRDRPTAPCCRSKGLVLRVLVGVLLAVVHLLLERLGLLLVGEGQPCLAFFQLERVEEDAILVVRERVVDLLVPDDATVGRLRSVSMSCAVWVRVRVLTDMSTSLIQKVLPTRSLASTAAPCRPVYVQLFLFG
jgi:hypothetical protein